MYRLTIIGILMIKFTFIMGIIILKDIETESTFLSHNQVTTVRVLASGEEFTRILKWNLKLYSLYNISQKYTQSFDVAYFGRLYYSSKWLHEMYSSKIFTIASLRVARHKAEISMMLLGANIQFWVSHRQLHLIGDFLILFLRIVTGSCHFTTFYGQLIGLCSGRCDSDCKNGISEHMLRIKFIRTSCEIAFWKMTPNTFDDKSRLLLVTSTTYTFYSCK